MKMNLNDRMMAFKPMQSNKYALRRLQVDPFTFAKAFRIELHSACQAPGKTSAYLLQFINNNRT